VLLLLLLLYHVLGCGHHVATALTTQHLFELRFVLTICHLIVAAAEVYASAIREVSLTLIIGTGHCAGERLTIKVVLRHGRRRRRTRFDLLEHIVLVGHTLKLNIICLLQLQLSLLIAHLVLMVSTGSRGTLPTSRGGAMVPRRHHAHLAHVLIRIVIHLSCIVCCNDSSDATLALYNC
jgi:hypothetical protein